MTKKTLTVLQADAETLFVTNTSGSITPALILTFITDLIDSVLGKDDITGTADIGSMNINDEATGITVDDVKVLGEQQSNIAQLSGGATLNDVITALNTLLTALKTHGIIEPDPA